MKIVFTFVLSVGLCLTCGCRNQPQVTTTFQDELSTQQADAAVSQADEQADLLRDKWGIKVEAVHLSAGGYMIDFRYRVLDAEKAKAIGDPEVKPYIIDQSTGAKFIVPSPPKVGPMRNTENLQEGRVYFIFFGNPGKYIKSGQKITVCVGDIKIENLEVL